MSDKLSRNDELKLHGIKALSEHYNKLRDDLIRTVCEITGDPDEGGYCCDFVCGGDMTPAEIWERTAKARNAKA